MLPHQLAVAIEPIQYDSLYCSWNHSVKETNIWLTSFYFWFLHVKPCFCHALKYTYIIDILLAFCPPPPPDRVRGVRGEFTPFKKCQISSPWPPPSRKTCTPLRGPPCGSLIDGGEAEEGPRRNKSLLAASIHSDLGAPREIILGGLNITANLYCICTSEHETCA